MIRRPWPRTGDAVANTHISSATPPSSRPIRVTSEPPSESDVEGMRRLHDRRLVALDDVIHFQALVGTRVVRGANTPGVSIKFLQRQDPRRHLKLGIEVLVPDEPDEIPSGTGVPHAIAGLTIESAQPLRNVRRDTGQQ